MGRKVQASRLRMKLLYLTCAVASLILILTVGCTENNGPSEVLPVSANGFGEAVQPAATAPSTPTPHEITLLYTGDSRGATEPVKTCG